MALSFKGTPIDGAAAADFGSGDSSSVTWYQVIELATGRVVDEDTDQGALIKRIRAWPMTGSIDDPYESRIRYEKRLPARDSDGDIAIWPVSREPRQNTQRG